MKIRLPTGLKLVELIVSNTTCQLANTGCVVVRRARRPDLPLVRHAWPRNDARVHSQSDWQTELETGCSRSGFAGEWQRSPIPNLGCPVGWLSAVPLNLTFVVGGADQHVSRLMTRSNQRLLPPTTDWAYRP